uniref:CCHC-type domain-containing protein n=1 Tax=Salmo trutta TaxID=8032 RepID=A0A673WBY2_SALTR
KKNTRLSPGKRLPRPPGARRVQGSICGLSLLGLLAQIYQRSKAGGRKRESSSICCGENVDLRPFFREDMATNSSAGSVPRTGLKNTIRFAWKKEEETRMPRDSFGRAVLMGALKLRVSEVMCLQGNAMEEAYDVTLHTEGMCDVVMDRVKVAAEERPLSFFNITCLAKTNFRTINVHMYNLHVADIAIGAFLSRFCDVTSGARYVKDSLGFWNGRRQFQVLLRPDKGGFDGFLHPPAVFSLGSDRGMLFYTRQPPFCKKCREYGHVTAACSTGKCRFCKSGEECDEPKACHGCGSSAHLWRDCPARHRSYAYRLIGVYGP